MKEAGGWKMSHTLRRSAWIGLCLAFCAAPAMAGPSFTFSPDTSSKPQQGPSGTVTLTQDAHSSNTVDVLVRLNANFGFVNSGNSSSVFTFAINTASLSGISVNFTDPAGGTYTYTQGNNTSTINFGYNTNTAANVTDVSITDTSGNGQSRSYTGSLGFQVSSSTGQLTAADFIDALSSTVDTNKAYFVAELNYNNSDPRQVAWETRRVPEPAPLFVIGAVLAAFGLIRRRFAS